MRPGKLVLGAVSGLLFGFFVGLDLFMFKVIQSDSALIVVLPVVGLVVGVLLGVLRSGKAKTALNMPST
jgi:hypothetical protein